MTIAKGSDLVEEQLQKVFASYKGERSELIAVLQDVQKEIGYLPEEAMEKIARFVRVPESKVFGAATFYAQFKMKPRGKYIIRVCKGTACHIQGSDKISERIEDLLKVESGDTTDDLKFTLEEVACIGACALAPVMMINDNPHGRLTPDKIKGILDSYE
ncbi:MAG: NADH-quinone oxidoreductase subunit NuoE [Bacillota bacterium]|nr:NADH-quinone oxidoreductase subunit NuoE [Bacillota bacterium]